MQVNESVIDVGSVRETERILLHTEVADTYGFHFARLVHLLHVRPSLIEGRMLESDEVRVLGNIWHSLREMHEPLVLCQHKRSSQLS